MKISIITVCKNAENHIKNCLESVVNQTYTNYEYIIIDGKSEDRTLDIINQYSRHITKLISEPDQGLYQAMNKGINLATGDFLYFLNSDDYLFDAHVLTDVAATLTKQSESDFLYGKMQLRNTSGESSFHTPQPPEILKPEMIFSCAIPHPTSFFRATLFQKLGNFDETYRISGDYEWFTRLLKEPNIKIIYSDRLISSYYCGGLSGVNLKLAYQEVFNAQNSSGLFNIEDAELRIQKLQEFCINQQELVGTLRKLAEERQQYTITLKDYVSELENSVKNLTTLANNQKQEIAASKFGKFKQLLKKIALVLNKY